MELNFIEVLICITLSSFGGLVKRLSDSEKFTDHKKATFTYYLAGSLISMFVGMVVFFICKNFEVSQFLTAGLTALSGYIGTPALDLLSELARKRISHN
jgi:hypothetical protein